MIIGEPKIVARKVVTVPERKHWHIDVPIKVYRFESGRNPEGYKHLEDSAKKSIEIMADAGHSCEVGIGSVYGFETPSGYVDGAALAFLRGNSPNPDNPMYHPWAWESGRELHLGKEGSNCRKEITRIFGPEMDLHRELGLDRKAFLKKYAAKTDLDFFDAEKGDFIVFDDGTRYEISEIRPIASEGHMYGKHLKTKEKGIMDYEELERKRKKGLIDFCFERV